MIHALSRRLGVRDDGTGRSRDATSTFSEFETEDAIILLGDPGMGKTTFFKVAANANYTTVRNFLIDPHAVTGEPLFLDALDEYRTVSTGQDASAEVARVLCALKKPKFRLSCRAADWFGSLDHEALGSASASGRVVVLDLRPLTREEILNAVQPIVPDPSLFIDEAESAGLGSLLGNPQTLELIAMAWGSGKKPQNKFEAYEFGVSELLKEMNMHHSPRGAKNSNPRDLRKAAGAGAATLLLSNSAGFSRTDPAHDRGYVNLSTVPHPNRRDLDAMLKRRLFVSSEADRFELVHRTIAEFLAAEDLSNRIINGLPIDRVIALICGVDGKPISSLRGLFAWLMCRLGQGSVDYVGRDPYGVAMYGDASSLPPAAQCAIWADLGNLQDPWFLANEEDRGSFLGLANLNTVKLLRDILQNPTAGVHLKITVLEAIANCKDSLGLEALLRDKALKKDDNTWLRSQALKAFANSVKNDWSVLKTVDEELAEAFDDSWAPEIRATLLSVTREADSLPLRVLSILEQDNATARKQRPIGRFHSLIDVPSDLDLVVILDGISRMFVTKQLSNFEIRFLFKHWFKRYLENPAPIAPLQLASCLQTMQAVKEHHSDTLLKPLKARFNEDLSLFENVFQLLAIAQNTERSFMFFLVHDLWELLPSTVWPVRQSEFFLARAAGESNPERAAEFFKMYLSRFPIDGGSVILAEAGFEFVNRRQDVAKALGTWNICKIEAWRNNQTKTHEKQRRKESANRARSIAYLMPRLTTIREGSEESVLTWATQIYEGLSYDFHDTADPRDRLVRAANEEIADALIEGFIRYIENDSIPKAETVIQNWCGNSIPYAHILLSLSVFLRLRAGMAIPTGALASCIAAVVTNFHTCDTVPEWNEILPKWLPQEIDRHPSVVSRVLREIWVANTTTRKGDLPGFYELNVDPNCAQFLASLSADVLKTGISEDHYTVDKLLSVLLPHDRQAVLEIGEIELRRAELSMEVRAIWSTVMFAIDPTKYLETWKSVMSESGQALWQAINVIGSTGRKRERGHFSLTPAQHAEVIASVGRRFPNVAFSAGRYDGSQNPWDASQFVANEIKLLAGAGSQDTDAQLQRLENDSELESYRDLVRHQRAQHQKQQRESSFAFASPQEVAAAIENRSPATPSDLLAFVVDHLNVLGRELARTQRERYRAYWIESGRSLVKPRREEVCSGFLADDLQNRVKAQELIVTVEHHMVADKECDLMVLQGTERLLPIEVKHHYHKELWTAWRTQLDRLYTRDARAGGLGIYLVLWSGEGQGRKMRKLPKLLKRPGSASELKRALESLIPGRDRHRLQVVVVDISPPQ